MSLPLTLSLSLSLNLLRFPPQESYKISLPDEDINRLDAIAHELGKKGGVRELFTRDEFESVIANSDPRIIARDLAKLSQGPDSRIPSPKPLLGDCLSDEKDKVKEIIFPEEVCEGTIDYETHKAQYHNKIERISKRMAEKAQNCLDIQNKVHAQEEANIRSKVRQRKRYQKALDVEDKKINFMVKQENSIATKQKCLNHFNDFVENLRDKADQQALANDESSLRQKKAYLDERKRQFDKEESNAVGRWEAKMRLRKTYQDGLDEKFGEYVLHEEEENRRRPKKEEVDPPDSADRHYELVAGYKAKRKVKGADACQESTGTVDLHHGERRKLTQLLLKRSAAMIRKQRTEEAGPNVPLGASKEAGEGGMGGAWSYLPTMAEMTETAVQDEKSKKKAIDIAKSVVTVPAAGGRGSEGAFNVAGGVDKRVAAEDAAAKIQGIGKKFLERKRETSMARVEKIPKSPKKSRMRRSDSKRSSVGILSFDNSEAESEEEDTEDEDMLSPSTRRDSKASTELTHDRVMGQNYKTLNSDAMVGRDAVLNSKRSLSQCDTPHSRFDTERSGMGTNRLSERSYSAALEVGSKGTTTRRDRPLRAREEKHVFGAEKMKKTMSMYDKAKAPFIKFIEHDGNAKKVMAKGSNDILGTEKRWGR